MTLNRCSEKEIGLLVEKFTRLMIVVVSVGHALLKDFKLEWYFSLGRRDFVKIAFVFDFVSISRYMSMLDVVVDQARKTTTTKVKKLNLLYTQFSFLSVMRPIMKSTALVLAAKSSEVELKITFSKSMERISS